MKGKKGFTFAQVVLLAVVFALIFAWCAGAQEKPPAKNPERPTMAPPAATEEARAPRAWTPGFETQYNKFTALLDEVRKLSAATEYLQERVNTLQRELQAQIPPGYSVDERQRMFVPIAVSPAPAAVPPTPPVPTPTMVTPVPPINEKPKPPEKAPEKAPAKKP